MYIIQMMYTHTYIYIFNDICTYVNYAYYTYTVYSIHTIWWIFQKAASLCLIGKGRGTSPAMGIHPCKEMQTLRKGPRIIQFRLYLILTHCQSFLADDFFLVIANLWVQNQLCLYVLVESRLVARKILTFCRLSPVNELPYLC